MNAKWEKLSICNYELKHTDLIKLLEQHRNAGPKVYQMSI